MKIFIFLILFLSNTKTYSQCNDVYGNTSVCPSAEDSMLIYENSLKVSRYYDNNIQYRKIRSTKIITTNDFKKLFFKLDSSVQNFRDIWLVREKYLRGEDMSMMSKGILLPRGGKNIPVISYFENIDEYRFYQREMEHTILDINSPFPIYDMRIAPLLINVYRNIDSRSDYFGDEVEVAQYVPVTVKPVALLTKEEIVARTKILKGTFLAVIPEPKIKKTQKIILSKSDDIKDSIKLVDKEEVKIKKNKDTIKIEPKIIKKIDKTTYFSGIILDSQPIFVTNGITFSIVGFQKNRTFYKVPKSLYEEYAIQVFAKIILNDDTELSKILKSKFGDYINKIVGENYELKF